MMHWSSLTEMVLEVSAPLFCIKELFFYFQKLVSGKLHTFYSGRFPSPGIEPGFSELNTRSLCNIMIKVTVTYMYIAAVTNWAI